MKNFVGLIFIIIISIISTKPGYNNNIDSTGLHIEITNINNIKGQVLLSIHDNKDNFPYKPLKTFDLEKGDLANGRLEFFIKDIKPGEYAITVLDDRNSNRDMDKNWLGLPKEGFGFSKNVKPAFLNIPDFEKCSFEIGKEKVKTKIIMQYF